MHVSQECAHVIDAACLAGQDVRRLAFAERRRRVSLLLQGLEADPACLAQEGRGGARRLPLRLKPVWPLRELPAALAAGEARREAGGAQWRHRGVFLFPGHHVEKPSRPEGPQWKKQWSNSNAAEYWFNRSTGQSKWLKEVEAEMNAPPRPISLRSCVANLLRWDRQKALEGGIEEGALKDMAAAIVLAAERRKAEQDAAAPVVEQPKQEPRLPAPTQNGIFDGVRF